jgi:pseudaminic acid biosynthesis-associated methylase
MIYETDQIKAWKKEFGQEYTERNIWSAQKLDEFYIQTFGISRSALNEEFLGHLHRDIKILEIGCNVGQQLRHLQLLGFKNLYGIEIQPFAVETAKSSTQNINIICGSGFDVPFRDEWFDLVFTSGVLIHIHPNDMAKILREIYRCSKKYIWGYEYDSKNLEEVFYRGNKGLLWKRDFCRFYLDTFPGLKLVKEKKLNYRDNDNVDQMFLLEKS